MNTINKLKSHHTIAPYRILSFVKELLVRREASTKLAKDQEFVSR
jgi:hypothetical protein